MTFASSIPTTGPAGLVLSRLHGIKPNGSGSSWTARCPAHDDGQASLSVTIGDEGRVLLKCFAGCTAEDAVSALGLQMKDLFVRKDYRQVLAAARSAPSPVAKPPAPLTVRDLSAAKGIDEPFLRKQGLEDTPEGVVIEYRLMDGSPAPRRRIRKALAGEKMWAWLPGEGSPVPYGLDRLLDAREQGFLVLVEGESDCWTLWLRGFPTLGIPGSAMASKIEPEHLDGIPEIYCWREPDKGGDTFAAGVVKRLREINYTGKTHEMKVSGVKDPSDLYLASPGKFNDVFLKAIAEAVPAEAAVEPIKEPSLEPKPAPIGPKSPLFASLATLLAKPRPMRWLVKGLIESPSTAVTFGPSGGGKSFVMVDLAASTATGVQWCGRGVVAGPVFYIAGEGRTGLLRRFEAWQLKRKVKIPDDRLFLSAVRIELNDLGAAEVELEVKRIAGEIGAAPVLIIVDTLARALPTGSDENSAKDMGAFINIVDRLRDRFQCVAMIVHHSGVADDKRTRGSTALKGALETELRITSRGVTRIADWTKLKDLPEEPHPQEFVLEKELLGQDDDGNFITSCVVEWKGETEVKASTTVTAGEDLGLLTLKTAIKEGDDGGFDASLEGWRRAYYKKSTAEDTAAKRQAFNRIRKSLAQKGLITVDNDRYSITGKRS